MVVFFNLLQLTLDSSIDWIKSQCVAIITTLIKFWQINKENVCGTRLAFYVQTKRRYEV